LNVVRKQAGQGLLYKSATTLLAEILHMQGHEGQAYEMLYPIKDSLTPEQQALLHQLAFNQNHYKEAIGIGNALYQSQPTDKIAVINALSNAHLGQARPAIGWLQCAIKNGLPNIKEVLQKDDFNSIRDDPLFAEFSKTLV
jgi:stage IV sporulation protein FB